MSNLLRLFQPLSVLQRRGGAPLPTATQTLTAPRGWQYFAQPVAVPEEWGLQRILVYRYLRGPDGIWGIYPWWRFPKARWPRLSEAHRLLRKYMAADVTKEALFAIGSGRHLCLQKSRNGLYFLFSDISLTGAQNVDNLMPILNTLKETLAVQVPFFPPLSVTQKPLLRLLMQGMSSAEIAQELSVSRQKINRILGQIKMLFGVLDREELLVCLWQAYRKDKAWFYL